MSERATVRPVTLARLAELTNICETDNQTTVDVEDALNVSHRRARETLLEATRIGLLSEIEPQQEDQETTYKTTEVGSKFLVAVEAENWERVSSILATRSPHYGAFLETVAEIEPATLEELLEQLEEDHVHSTYDFNQTTIEVVGDWGERLGAIQRNAFTGTYYSTEDQEIPSNFPFIILSVFDELEETAGVNLSQRYLSIPELREYTCERIGCKREQFDDALLTLAQENVGKIELSGAPMDTGAKEAKLGIKEIELSTEDGFVSTTQSTERVMNGVEQFDKQYYYLAVHDNDLTYNTDS
jgi:DNA-binding HxlR family transcriptional regulator